MEAILATNCYSLLDRFMSHHPQNNALSPSSEVNSNGSSHEFDPNSLTARYELYIPTPSTVDAREDLYLHHTATRNLFAYICGKPLIGSHLGGALVGLLNSMNEFLPGRENNLVETRRYMDEQGYADLTDSPDHALALLFFADHFQVRDMWIDAFAHCTGMHERLPSSLGFEVRITKPSLLRTLN
jgi:hypothetical protein